MNSKLISLVISALLAGGSATAAIPAPQVWGANSDLWPDSDINSISTAGKITRGILYFDMLNEAGAVDRLSEAWRNAKADGSLSPAEMSELTRILAIAEVLDGNIDPIGTVKRWLSDNKWSPRRADMTLLLADLQLENDQLGDAYRSFRKIDIDALNPSLRDDFLFHSAFTDLRLANYDDARKGFDNKELLNSPRYSNAARFYLGYINYIDRDYTGALNAWENVNTSAMPGRMADYYKAQIAYYQGRYSEALRLAKPLIDDSEAPVEYIAEANRIVGESLYQRGESSAAIPYLKKYMSEIENPEPSTRYILGLAYYEQGQYKNAVDILTPVTADKSAMGQSAYLYIGQALLKLGDDSAAILAFNRAIAMDFDPAVTEVAYYNYAVAKSRGAGVPFASSVQTFEEFLNKYPDSKFADSVAGYLITGYVTDGDYESALNSINKVHNPSQSILAAKQKVLYMLGGRRLASGAAKDAVSILTEAQELAHYDAETALETKLLLGEALYRTGQYAEAAEVLLDYLDEVPHNASNRAIALYDLGYTRLAQKEWNKAQINFERIIANPGNLDNDVLADVQARLGDARYYQHNWSGAAAAYDAAYTLNPDQGDYPLFQKAVMQGYNHDYTGKIDTLDKLSDDFPTSPLIPDALLEQAEAYTQLKDPVQTRNMYRRLIDNYSETKQGRQAYLYLAAALAGGGSTNKAIDTYEELIRIAPTSDEALLADEAVKRLHAERGTLNEYADFVETVNGIPALDSVEAETLSWNASEHAYLDGKGVALLEKYVKQYPAGIYTARALAYLLDDAQDKDDDASAYRYATQIIARYPDNAAVEEALIVKGDIDYDSGRGRDALQTWEMLEQKASTAQNRNIARLGIMRVARDIGDAKRMEAAADALLQSSALGADEKTEAAFSRGLAFNLSGDTDTAISIWSDLVDNTDDLYGAKAAVYTVEALNASGRYDKAEEVADEFVNSGTPHTYWLARGFIALADALSGLNRQFEAAEYLKALKENYPGKESDIFEMIDIRLK